MSPSMIEIDGSYGESGGQIVRTALSLSAITKKPVHIFNIRAGRPNPGLQAQHLTACKAVRNVCRGNLEGAELKSSELAFHPGEIIGGKYEFDIGTAGSTCLVAQTLLPILLFANKPSLIKIVGGTHVIKSPSYDYFEKVFLPAIAKFGINAKAKMIKPGYYPRGGGEIEVEINPGKIAGCENWKLETENKLQVLIRLSQLPTGIAVREKKIFVQNGIEKIFVREDAALDPANALLIWQGLKGIYALGEKGKRAEEVAQEALEEFKLEIGEVDRHLADQLLIYAALAEGKSKFSTSQFTEHLKTNAEIIQKFLPERKIELEDKTVRIG